MRPEIEALTVRLEDVMHLMQRDGLQALIDTAAEAAALIRRLAEEVEELRSTMTTARAALAADPVSAKRGK